MTPLPDSRAGGAQLVSGLVLGALLTPCNAYSGLKIGGLRPGPVG